MSDLVRFAGASFLSFASQKQGIIYCLHWDLALIISTHVLVDGVGLWIHQKMICKLSFLALLFLLKQQQAACSGSLKKGPKTYVPSMCVGNDVLAWDRWKTFCQVLPLTRVAAAKAHISYFLIRSHCSAAIPASLREWSRKSHSFKVSY